MNGWQLNMDFLEVLTKYASHDNWYATDKITTHSYGDVYNDIIPSLRARNKPLTILEIGVMSGMFVRSLAEYLPTAEIHGVDIQLTWLQYKGDGENRVHFHVMDATVDNAPEQLGGLHYDLIVEDASHKPNDQRTILNLFAPYLRKDGVYIIEDIVPDETLQKDLLDIATKHQLTMEWIDLRHQRENIPDNVMAIFRKRW